MLKDFLMPGEKPRCFASTSLPLSMPPTLSFLPNPDENSMYRDFEDLQLPAMSETFEVTIQRNSLGLGLSIMGGPDGGPPFKHLIRVKKLFPLQPAWQTGMIQPGDILLKADQKILTGLTLRQALDVLRCSPPVTTLLVCRPLPEFFVTRSEDGASVDDYYQEEEMSPSKFSSKVLRSYSYTPATRQLSLSMPRTDPNEVSRDVAMETSDANRYFMSTPEPEMRQGDVNFLNTNYNNDLELFSPISIQNNNNLNSGSGPDVGKNSNYYGEFTIILRKVNGSLGFTLYSQTDDSTVLRHSVKALVKEPALSDGRIRAGDKLVAANDIECGHLSHQELIQFLRKCPEEVTLRFYRDASRSQTPVSTPQHPIAPALADNPAKKSFFFNEKTQKFANFFASSSSHPDLAFTSQGQSSKPKQLRAEAKEMVRSLQASRSSLENGAGAGGPETLTKNGSNASGGGNRRKIRPFSPARDRPQPNPICLSASAPSPFPKHLVAASGDSLSTSPVQSPTVESPMTPSGSQSDFVKSNLQYYSINDEEMSVGVGRLQIEELPTNESFAGKSSFSSYSSSSASSDYLRYSDPTNSNSNFGAKFERPTELDLFGSGSRKQQGYIFNK